MRSTSLLPLLLLCPLLGCSKKDDALGECDAERPCQAGQCVAGVCVPDTALPDLSTPPAPDLRMDLRQPDDLAKPACGGMRYQWATNDLRLPGNTDRFAVDFDGDGRADNQFRAIMGVVAAANLDVQPPVSEAVAAGRLVELLDLDAAGLADADCAALKVQAAVPRGPGDPRPKYDGTDRFTVPMGAMPAELAGAIKAGRLETTRPPMLPEDNVPRIDLQLPLLGAALSLPLYGVHVQGSVSGNGVMSGELHGVIRKEDIDLVIIPAIADLLTQTIRADPLSTTTDTLVRLFEDPAGNAASRMKCMVARDCCQLPANRATCKILPEEVKSNALIGNVLAPDVQVFQGGKWKPVPGGADRNGLSVGLGFTAVRASF